MITESLLNSYYFLVFNKNINIKRGKKLYEAILDTLNFYKTSQGVEIPLEAQDKFNCLVKICKMKIEGKSDDNVIDSLSLSGKYKDLLTYINNKTIEESTQEKALDNLNQLSLRKRFNSLIYDFDKMCSMVDCVRDANFESLDDLIGDYQVMVRNMYTRMMEDHRSVQMEASNSLNLDDEDFEDLIDILKNQYTNRKITSTGFSIFDNEVFFGGFEPKRLYILAGGSGSGKSTLLLNLITRGSKKDCGPIGENLEIKKENIKKVFIYVTLENTLEESFLRIYQNIFNKTIKQSIDDFQNYGSAEIKRRVVEYFKSCGSTLVMRYFPSYSITASSLIGVLDEAVETYGKDSIRGLYVDYLDLLLSENAKMEYRLQLSEITSTLKTLAVDYEIPIITATQLGRASYKIQHARELSLDMMSEAIKKVEHADFVCLMARNVIDDDLIHCLIGKNRSGKKLALDFMTDFSTYNFKVAKIVCDLPKVNESNNNQQDSYYKGNNNTNYESKLEPDQIFDKNDSMFSSLVGGM